MPKKKIIKTILILLVLSLICKYIYDNYRVIHKTSLYVEESLKCDLNLKDYYQVEDGDYYLYCLDEVIVDFTDRTLELNKALAARQIDIDTIKSMLTKKYSLNKEKINYYENDNLSLLECVNKNKTNYIIGKDFEYVEGMCNSKPYLTTFNREYYVLDVSKSKTKNISYITLSDMELDDVVTVSVDSKYDLLEDTMYVFTFGKYNEITSLEINDIFNDYVLLDIKEKVEDK